ncbi:MAG: UDP-3-O-(3-hydroxymyristoyl)glucosamine N-acyltransferase [Thermoanaerobaculia bacterium]
MPTTLGALARRVGGEVRGNAERVVRGIRSLERAGSDDLAFVSSRRHLDRARASGAGALLVPPSVAAIERDLLVVPDPHEALVEILPIFAPPSAVGPGIHPTAVVDGARIDPSATVGPYAVVGAGSEVGARAVLHAHVVVGAKCIVSADCLLHPGVVLYDRTELGERCVVHAGVVLGGDGYGYASGSGEHRKLAHLGRVVLEDDVEVGANSTVDRGMLEETRLGAGTKVDNLVMVAHNVVTGRRCLLVAQSGVAGSARLGDGVVLAAQSGIIGHVEIGAGTTVGTKSALLRSSETGEKVAGIPAGEMGAWKRQQALLRRLPELFRRLRALESGKAKREDEETS